MDVIVIGAGAAGLFCAIAAGKRGRRVLVLEHNTAVGKKIAISGGGRCNFTNTNCSASNFISRNPNFCKSALARFSPQDFIDLVDRHAIPWHEKKLGQLFCDHSAHDIIQMLLEECEDAGVEIVTDCHVERVLGEDGFSIESNRGVYTAPSLVIATGGLSIPTLGATDFGLRVARQFGLNIFNPVAGLVPLAYDESHPSSLKELSGISAEVTAAVGSAWFHENLLLTHRGLSGPAILQVSSYWKPGETVEIDLAPGVDLAATIKSNQQVTDLSRLVSQFLSKRLAILWCEITGSKKPIPQLSKSEIEELNSQLHKWQLRFNKSEGFRKAEVTVGGVDTAELSSKTMESKKVQGLYFIGEVVDVTGWLGGYNFQWAWASGFAAGQYV